MFIDVLPVRVIIAEAVLVHVPVGGKLSEPVSLRASDYMSVWLPTRCCYRMQYVVVMSMVNRQVAGPSLLF